MTIIIVIGCFASFFLPFKGVVFRLLWLLCFVFLLALVAFVVHFSEASVLQSLTFH